MKDMYEVIHTFEYEDTSEVEWRSIPGFIAYEVNNQGEVRKIGGQPLSSSKHTQGYRLLPLFQYTQEQWDLAKQGVRYGRLHGASKRKTVTVHRLVASAFLGRELIKEEVVDHIDRNESNNKLNNLRVCSQRVNMSNASDSVMYTHKEVTGTVAQILAIEFGFTASCTKGSLRFHPAWNRIMHNARYHGCITKAIEAEMRIHGLPIEEEVEVRECKRANSRKPRGPRKDNKFALEFIETFKENHYVEGAASAKYMRFRVNREAGRSVEEAYNLEISKYVESVFGSGVIRVRLTQFEKLTNIPAYKDGVLHPAAGRYELTPSPDGEWMEKEFRQVGHYPNWEDPGRAPVGEYTLEFEEFFGIPCMRGGKRHPAFHRIINNMKLKVKNPKTIQQRLDDELVKYGTPVW